MHVKRGWIIGGAVFLQGLLLIAAFSLGVYLERYGLTDEGLVYQGPGGAQDQRNQPPGGLIPPGAGMPDAQGQNIPPFLADLDEQPDLTGRIIRITPERLELATPQGRRIITLNEETIYQDIEGRELVLRDLHLEMIVAVVGHLANQGQELVAEQVIVLPVAEGTP
jgi:hypothetical protein